MTNRDTPWLSVDNVSAEIGDVKLIEGINLTAEQGELIGLIGPNGAGKSSLLKALAQLITASGNITLDDKALRSLSHQTRAITIAYLGQQDHAGWPLTVVDFVSLGRQPYQRAWAHGLSRLDRSVVGDVMKQTDLDSLKSRRMNELSGGERARVRLARALAVQAPLLLADEPVASLDPFHQLSVMSLLKQQCEQGKTAIVVLHDLTLASRFCDRLLLLNHGCQVDCGMPRQVLTPKNLQKVYHVEMMHGEHQQQTYVVPWACNPKSQALKDGIA